MAAGDSLRNAASNIKKAADDKRRQGALCHETARQLQSRIDLTKREAQDRISRLERDAREQIQRMHRESQERIAALKQQAEVLVAQGEQHFRNATGHDEQAKDLERQAGYLDNSERQTQQMQRAA